MCGREYEIEGMGQRDTERERERTWKRKKRKARLAMMSRRAGFLVVTLGAHRTNGEYLINQCSVVTPNVCIREREEEKDDIQNRDRIKEKQNKE